MFCFEFGRAFRRNCSETPSLGNLNSPTPAELFDAKHDLTLDGTTSSICSYAVLPQFPTDSRLTQLAADTTSWTALENDFVMFAAATTTSTNTTTATSSQSPDPA